MPFLSRAVFESRRAAMRRLMSERNVEALAFESRHFFEFATGFNLDVEPWERPVLAIVPFHGEPFCVLNALSTNHFRFAREAGRVWVDLVTFYGEHPGWPDPGRRVDQWPSLVADVLTEEGLSCARLGVERGSGLGRLKAMLPKVTLVPMEAELRALRWVKHEEEIELARRASGLADWAQDRYRENIRPGRLTQELDAAMSALIYEEAAVRFPGECLEIPCALTLSGPASAAGHGDGAPTGARISRGDGLVNIVELRLNGIVVENERTWFCGRPSPDQERFYAAAVRAQEAAVEAVVTGKPVRGIDEAARAVYEQAGLTPFVHTRAGHGMGLTSHEFPEDMAFNDRSLMTGEIYAIEPGIYVFGLGGFRVDDTVVVGAQPELLTRTSTMIIDQTVCA